jgi:Protein tyrosine and serine/threonine kinase
MSGFLCFSLTLVFFRFFRSFGILLMEIFTYGEIHYKGMNNQKTTDQVQRGYRMPMSTNHLIPESTYELMLKCWNSEPEKRPNFEFIIDFFENLSAYSEVSHVDYTSMLSKRSRSEL